MSSVSKGTVCCLVAVIGLLLITLTRASKLPKQIESKGTETRRRVRRSLCGDYYNNYDPNYSICCQGYLHSRTSYNDLSRCCRTRSYNAEWYMCCDGQVVSKKRSHTRCCGTRTYNPLEYDCCGENLLRRLNGQANGCCKGRPYDPRYFTCCQGRLTWRSGSGWCCGSREYDNQSHICCQEVLLGRSSSSDRCCGDQSYNPEFYVCCNNRITWKPGNGDVYYCCAGRAFDPYFYQCCRGSRITWRSGRCY